MLPVKKIYLDSRFKTSDSKSHTDFKIDLGQSYYFPDDTYFYVDDVNIPNSWYSVESNSNSRMYVRYLHTYQEGYKDVIVNIPSEVYNGESFITAVSAVLNAEAANLFTVVYDPNKNTLNISLNEGICFQIFSDDELRFPETDFGRGALGVDVHNLMSINEVIRNEGKTGVYNYNGSKNYVSGYLDFLRYNNIYLSSPNVGNFNTHGPMGQQTIIRKVPVSAGNGFVINDRVVNKHDILDCSKATLRTVEFRFHDAYGRTINLNGGHVSFSLVFTSVKEDR